MKGIKVSGDSVAGWIVEMHDGAIFHSVGVIAKNEAEATKVALDAWYTQFKSAFNQAEEVVKKAKIPKVTSAPSETKT